jgi:hypothetical protein
MRKKKLYAYFPHCSFRELRMIDCRYSPSSVQAAEGSVTAERLISVDNVHWVRVHSSGTFAEAYNHSVSGMDFLIARMKYLAVMFLDAERSQL